MKSGPAPGHSACFFSEGRYPARSIAQFLAEGVAAGHPTAVLATSAHAAVVREALRAAGLSPDAVRFHDAEEIVSSCIRQGRVQSESFGPLLARILDELCSGGREVRIYGEVVDVLCLRGQPAAAIALEEVWNEVMSRRPVSLLCGYSLSSFRADADGEAYLAVCGSHAEIRLDAQAPDLHVVANALTSEIGRRRSLEVERAHLRRVTSALSEVQALAGLTTAFERDICGLLGATQVFVGAGEEGEPLRTVSRVGSRDAGEDLALRVFGSGDSVWLHEGTRAVAAVPLRVGGRRTGVIVLGFPSPQAFDASQRALIEDVARQTAQCVDRVRAGGAKDELLAVLGHELRNPLAALRGAADLIGLTAPHGPARRAQAVLQRQIAHMGRLVDDLLDASRIARGKVALAKEPLDLVGLLSTMMRHRVEQAERLGLDLRVDLRPRSLWVEGDEARLTQVFDQLVSNAFQFTAAPGAVTVTARADDGQAVVTVRDTGVGIDADLLPHVFEPFRQAAQGLARTAGGLGLGLSLVQSLVALHGGRVVARSDGPGAGTELEVRIPTCAVPAEATGSTPPSWSSAIRVLIVEDSVDTAELLGAVLQLRGHEPAVAYDGETALDVARRFGPDVVLCDIGLPGGWDGYDVARALRSDDSLQSVFLVAVTGYGRPEDVQRAHEAGFDVHLTKPMDVSTVEDLLTIARDRRRSARRSTADREGSPA